MSGIEKRFEMTHWLIRKRHGEVKKEKRAQNITVTYNVRF